jgi:ubiquinone/menaquinone biosynthesis C-methylase UbiE
MKNEEKFNYEKKITGQRTESVGKYLRRDDLAKEMGQVKGRVLGVGCGAGLRAGKLKEKYPELDVYGVDISKTAIEMAKNDWPEMNFQVASAYRLPFVDSSFQGVYMRNVLEHLERPVAALKEVKRVLEPEGRFYCLTPLEGEKGILNPPERWARKFHGHVQRFTRKELEELYGQAGLPIKKCYYSGYWIYQLLGVGYCWWWEKGRATPDFSVAGYLEKETKGTKRAVVALMRKIIYAVTDLESLIIPRWVPGYSIHLVATKEKG